MVVRLQRCHWRPLGSRSSNYYKMQKKHVCIFIDASRPLKGYGSHHPNGKAIQKKHQNFANAVGKLLHSYSKCVICGPFDQFGLHLNARWQVTQQENQNQNMASPGHNFAAREPFPVQTGYNKSRSQGDQLKPWTSLLGGSATWTVKRRRRWWPNKRLTAPQTWWQLYDWSEVCF